MANPENLQPIRSTSEAREKGRAGGLRSGVKRRENATLKEAGRLLLSLDCIDEPASELLDRLGLDPDERTNAAAITAAMIIKAAKGDIRAYRALTTATSESPSDLVQSESQKLATPGQNSFPLIDTASLIPGCYNDMWRDIMNHGHSEYIAESGRGSLKTTVMLTEAPIMLMAQDEHLCGVGFRRVANTLRDSIFAAFLSSIKRMNLADYFEWTISPMMIRRRSTGQVILFRGMDNEDRAKGLQLTDPDMYLGFASWEEVDQNKGERAIRRVEQTIKRGTDRFWSFKAFNTPPDEEHWAHQYAARQEENGKALVVRYNYIDVPRDFLGEEFYADAEMLKEINEEAYRNEYLGECIGLTGRVFENVEYQTITDDDIAAFKWRRNGMDWGFQKDPWVFLRVAYDRKARTLYIYDEIYNTKTLDEPNVEAVKAKLYERDEEGAIILDSDSKPIFKRGKPANEVRADNSAPKDIANWNKLGIEVVPASKRIPVDDGIRWLQKRAKIVIDREKCPLAWQEFTRYRALEDDDGRFRGYPDKDNHTIDATRYAAYDLIADPDLT